MRQVLLMCETNPKSLFQKCIPSTNIVCFDFRGCFEEPSYFAEWKDAKDFTEILVCPEMVTDHMPDRVLKSLKHLSAKNFTPRSRKPGSPDDTQV